MSLKSLWKKATPSKKTWSSIGKAVTPSKRTVKTLYKRADITGILPGGAKPSKSLLAKTYRKADDVIGGVLPSGSKLTAHKTITRTAGEAVGGVSQGFFGQLSTGTKVVIGTAVAGVGAYVVRSFKK